MLHIEATEADDGWRKYFLYESGNNEYTNNDNGKRFIRLVDDGDKDNLLREGSKVSGSTNGFRWYDSSGGQTIEPGLTITVGKKSGNSYTVTITPNY